MPLVDGPLRLRESAESPALALESASLDQLAHLGRRLASQKAWWGDVEDERESSAIRAIPAAGGQWKIRVDNAVGVFSAGSRCWQSDSILVSDGHIVMPPTGTARRLTCSKPSDLRWMAS
jgi:hypothetical protein